MDVLQRRVRSISLSLETVEFQPVADTAYMALGEALVSRSLRKSRSTHLEVSTVTAGGSNTQASQLLMNSRTKPMESRTSIVGWISQNPTVSRQFIAKPIAHLGPLVGLMPTILI